MKYLLLITALLSINAQAGQAGAYSYMEYVDPMTDEVSPSLFIRDVNGGPSAIAGCDGWITISKFRIASGKVLVRFDQEKVRKQTWITTTGGRAVSLLDGQWFMDGVLSHEKTLVQVDLKYGTWKQMEYVPPTSKEDKQDVAALVTACEAKA